MFFIGIDVASKKHDCCIIDENQNILSSFSFTNSQHGFDLLLSKIASFTSPDNAKVGLESTGRYHVNLANFLRRNCFDVVTINPLLVNRLHRATTLRKTKTDKADARFLAQLISQRDFTPDREVLYHSEQMKSLSRARFSQVKSRSALKNRAKGLITTLFPEFMRLFSDTFGVAALAVLAAYPSAANLAKANVSKLEDILASASRGRFGHDKAVELIEAAKHSIGTYSPAAIFELNVILDEIEFYNKHIKMFDAEIERVLAASASLITTLPGIGTILGAMILGEIGSVDFFATPAKLLAFAGMEPSVSESGDRTSKAGSMVKHGSPYLRYALNQAARSAAQFDPVFRAYLDKKLAEAKHYNVAISHVAKKLVRILWTILKKNAVYSPDYSSLAA